MNILSSAEQERALRLLKFGYAPEEVVYKLLRDRDFALWTVISLDVDDLLIEVHKAQNESIVWRSVWDIIKSKQEKKDERL